VTSRGATNKRKERQGKRKNSRMTGELTPKVIRPWVSFLLHSQRTAHWWLISASEGEALGERWS
jgi:hypothetical protein